MSRRPLRGVLLGLGTISENIVFLPPLAAFIRRSNHSKFWPFFGDSMILHLSYDRFRDLSEKSELEELDKMEPSSAACNDVLSSMEGIPDALLPITKGPEHSAWERWFQPVRSSRNRKWWSNRESNVS
ncbi:guanine nucleotide-binding protein subunit gamma 2 isoform X1 [Dendrobium catenatum]|uniref:guanine nucleotide-binding protein subunit gamma 2 isoform X1 n=1 Tax=Dendrobium catenatum TaxID=906689 RepID=UPI00109FC80A|nr:guanine nucleotide-binding protein subunit gamma 2 isoform X1 [Dendrobium catenatum]